MSHPVIHHLQRITHERPHRVFDDWIGLTLAAYARDEPGYMAIIQRYGPRKSDTQHPADHFANALGALHVAMHDSCTAGETRDHLGEIYEQLSVQNKEMGQYFSPMHLCTLMAELSTSDDLPEDANIYDPACGSGRMLLATSLKRPKAHFHGTDLDQTCAMMTALNMLFHNLNSTIIHGDSLRLEARGGWMTRGTTLGGIINPYPANRPK